MNNDVAVNELNEENTRKYFVFIVVYLFHKVKERDPITDTTEIYLYERLTVYDMYSVHTHRVRKKPTD